MQTQTVLDTTGFQRILAIALLPVCAAGQMLPLRTYATADGLASNSVLWIVPDSRRFLWFCTQEGLSRFDGRQFANFGREHGLPELETYYLIETRRGAYWIATAGGVCRLRPSSRAGKGRFEVYLPEGRKESPVMTSLLEDRDGSIWCGSDEGLFRLVERDGRWVMHSVDLGQPAGPAAQSEVNAVLQDRAGSLWVAAFSGLYRSRADGKFDHFGRLHGLPVATATGLLQDAKGGLWAGTGRGLCRLKSTLRAGEPIVDRVYTTKDGLPSDYVRTLLETADGSLWIGTLSGLARAPWVTTPHAAAQAVTGGSIGALALDRDGNVWAGSSAGATKIAPTGFAAFNQSAGLHSANVVSVFENRQGELCVVTVSGARQVLHVFDGRRFNRSTLNLNESEHLLDRGSSQIALEDRAGEWWFADGRAVRRFPSMAHPQQHHSFSDPQGGGVAFRVYEDSRGDIWMSYSSWTRHGLQRWERATGKLQSFSERDGLPAMGINLPWVFAEDRDGNLWVGMSQNGLVRYRDGRFRHFGGSAGRVRALHLDSAGRLWAAWGSRGVLRIDDPGAAEPDLHNLYSRQHGLSGEVVHSIVEDNQGRIYLGMSGGIDRVDPKLPQGAGKVDHFNEGDGLMAGRVQAAFRDRSGALWFGTSSGLSRFIPVAQRDQRPPPVWITGVRSSGVRMPVSELGERGVSGLRFQPDQRQLEVDFVAPYFATGETLLYQSKLTGADPDWGVPSAQHSVNYANLAPGTYQLLVRAVETHGLAGEPASIGFEVLPPLWRRWWVLAIAAAFVVAAAAGAHRLRVSRLVELERVRVRIATDLHDDIGSGLSQLAILSDMVRRRLDGNAPQALEPLARIAAVSRELVDSMEDIVWSINPAWDRLQDLSRRMRQFATEVLESRGIDFELHAPDSSQDIALNPGTRRQLYLIFKEAIHNLRHSGCSKGVAILALAGGDLVLEVRDDGGGFPSGDTGDGHGLRSMRERARSLGGKLEIESGPEGAVVRARIPLGHSFLRINVGDGPDKLG